MVHLGGTRVLLHTVTMDAAQGVDFVRRIRPARTVPVHHDDYRVFRSSLAEFVALAGAVGLPGELRPVARGESIVLTR